MSGETPRRPGMVRVGPGELYGSSPAAAERVAAWRRDGSREAFELAREAQAAGLVVTVLVPLRHVVGEFQVGLYQPDGVLWAEGSNESAELIREQHIGGWRRRMALPGPVLEPHLDGPQDRDPGR